MEFAKRKSPRIVGYDYSNPNYYFITVCTHNRKCLFGDPFALNRAGEIAEKQINQIAEHYENVRVDKYVIMPNHVHMILVLENGNINSADQIIAQYKSGVTREVRSLFPDIVLWQRSFYDHIIRNQRSYENIWRYIDGNPQCWDKDCFFTDQE